MVTRSSEFQQSRCWCCSNNAKTCLVFAGIQIIYGMLYLIYSIVTWSIHSYPRVKSSLETYYAFGQPILVVIGGMGLILMVLACQDFSYKCFLAFPWILLQSTLLTITLSRLSEMVNNTTYEETYTNHLGILAADCFVSSATIFGEIFQMAAVIAHLCGQAEEEAQEDMKMEASQVKDINGNPVIAAQPQQMFMSQQPYIVSGYSPSYPHPMYNTRPYYGTTDAILLGMVAGSAMHGYYDPYCDGMCMY